LEELNGVGLLMLIVATMLAILLVAMTGRSKKR
jgi:hypothetical protein